MPKLSKHYVDFQNKRIDSINQQITNLNHKFLSLHAKLLQAINKLDYNDYIVRDNLSIIDSSMHRPVERPGYSVSDLFKKIYVGAVSESENNFFADVAQMHKLDDSLKDLSVLRAKKQNLMEAFSRLLKSSENDYLVENLRQISNHQNKHNDGLDISTWQASPYKYSSEAENIKNGNIANNLKIVANLYEFFDLINQAINKSLIGYVNDNNLSMAKMAIDLGADCQVKADGQNLLQIAVENNNVPMAKLLFDNGASIPYRYNDQTKSLIHTACEYENKDMVKLLIDHDANVNELIRPALSWNEWAWESFIRPIKQIFVKVPAIKGTSALHIAAKHHSYDIVDLLIKAGAKTEILDFKNHDYKQYLHSSVSAEDHVLDYVLTYPKINIEKNCYMKDYVPKIPFEVNWLKSDYYYDIYEKNKPKPDYSDFENNFPKTTDPNIIVKEKSSENKYTNIDDKKSYNNQHDSNLDSDVIIKKDYSNYDQNTNIIVETSPPSYEEAIRDNYTNPNTNIIIKENNSNYDKNSNIITQASPPSYSEATNDYYHNSLDNNVIYQPSAPSYEEVMYNDYDLSGKYYNDNDLNYLGNLPN